MVGDFEYNSEQQTTSLGNPASGLLLWFEAALYEHIYFKLNITCCSGVTSWSERSSTNDAERLHASAGILDKTRNFNEKSKYSKTIVSHFEN